MKFRLLSYLAYIFLIISTSLADSIKMNNNLINYDYLMYTSRNEMNSVEDLIFYIEIKDNTFYIIFPKLNEDENKIIYRVGHPSTYLIKKLLPDTSNPDDHKIYLILKDIFYNSPSSNIISIDPNLRTSLGTIYIGKFSEDNIQFLENSDQNILSLYDYMISKWIDYKRLYKKP